VRRASYASAAARAAVGEDGADCNGLSVAADQHVAFWRILAYGGTEPRGLRVKARLRRVSSDVLISSNGQSVTVGAILADGGAGGGGA